MFPLTSPTQRDGQSNDYTSHRMRRSWALLLPFLLLVKAASERSPAVAGATMRTRQAWDIGTPRLTKGDSELGVDDHKPGMDKDIDPGERILHRCNLVLNSNQSSLMTCAL
jgi:hypothetical protein